MTSHCRWATGEVVTFLDSHIEVSERWVEPLLARIKQDPKHVVMPIIDSIEPDSMEYMKGGLDVLAFSWSLGQKGVSRPMMHGGRV
jgi:polypeptide N-acetylgalactosaminyltransferase